ncbi:hypothetical protein BH09ACT1_BH09ACT1_25850 [soil metagenome]
MPWWSWLLIWFALGLALIGMFVFFGIRLFRKAMGVFHELEAVSERFEVLSTAAERLDEHRTELAVLAKRWDVSANRDRVREASVRRRDDRHDTRLARAKALTKADVTAPTWFGEKKR